MKVEKIPAYFTPIQITLETRMEVSTLLYILESVDKGYCPHYCGEEQAKMVLTLLDFLRRGG